MKLFNQLKNITQDSEKKFISFFKDIFSVFNFSFHDYVVILFYESVCMT